MSFEFKNGNGGYIDNTTAQSLSPEMKAVWDEMFTCRFEIANALKINGYPHEDSVVVGAYLLAKAAEQTDPSEVSLGELMADLDSDIQSLAIEYRIDQVWDPLKELLHQHSRNIFCLVANLQDMNGVSIPEFAPTSSGILELVSTILDVQDNETVADYCCGSGSFAQMQKKAVPSAKVTGYEITHHLTAIAKIREELFPQNIHITQADVFSLVAGEGDKPSFDKIFANYPLGQRLRDLNLGKNYIDQLAQRIPSMSRATSSDWLYNMLMVDTLNESGKAVGIMTNGGTWNMIDAPIRKYFVENGLIESVIALPAKLFSYTNIPTTMIVFSHGNSTVRLVDATEQFTPGRRVNELAENNVQVIVDALHSEGNISMSVSLEELRENDYVLNTSRYSHNSENIENGVAFETVIKRITRGAPLNANQLDEISSAVPTGMQYLLLSNIQNGLIETNLPYLSVIDKKNEKYCLSNHCLILSKNGYPYKIAVAEIREGQKVMANGNLYIIELDEEKVNPYYMAAFFGSEQGTAALKSITVGATVPNIGVDQLKKLIIPLPPLNEQEKIAERYQTVKDEITMLQLKLEKAKSHMMHIFEVKGD